MKKKRNQVTKILLVVLLIVVGIITLFFVSTALKASQSEEYYSESMKISFEKNADSEIQEKFNRILINKSNGQIIIDSIGTNFDSLQAYLSDLVLKNKLIIKEQEELLIDNMPVIKVSLDHNKIYYIYIPGKWTVYSISTSSPELYDDLDVIAQSFKYTGK